MIVAQAVFLQQRPQILGTLSLRLSVWRLRPFLPMQRGGGLVTAPPLLLGAPLEASSALPPWTPPTCPHLGSSPLLHCLLLLYFRGHLFPPRTLKDTTGLSQ